VWVALVILNRWSISTWLRRVAYFHPIKIKFIFYKENILIGKIVYLDHKEAVAFLLPKHYSGRIPSISYAFGWKINDELVAVCTFGKPASNTLCKGICGGKYSDKVYELNRLCRVDNLNLPLSQFVAGCLRRLKNSPSLNWIIVSYSDTDMNHHGYIYQALNFIYTGITKARTDKYTEGNKHSRHYDNNNQQGLRKIRSAKHRYVYFATKNKKLKKEYMENLTYPILPYPKGDNSNYVLGQYLETKIIKSN